MDRLDYLKRDAFYTGVVEGVINSERLLAMLNVANNELVMEQKGITSIEKFLVSRSLMYWQVYMHKTVLSAEYMLAQVLKRANELAQSGTELFAGKSLAFFLAHRPNKQDFMDNPEVLEAFTLLDDADITGAMKQWMHFDDPVLSQLCTRLINRQLFQLRFLEQDVSEQQRS